MFIQIFISLTVKTDIIYYEGWDLMKYGSFSGVPKRRSEIENVFGVFLVVLVKMSS